MIELSPTTAKRKDEEEGEVDSDDDLDVIYTDAKDFSSVSKGSRRSAVRFLASCDAILADDVELQVPTGLLSGLKS